MCSLAYASISALAGCDIPAGSGRSKKTATIGRRWQFAKPQCQHGHCIDVREPCSAPKCHAPPAERAAIVSRSSSSIVCMLMMSAFVGSCGSGLVGITPTQALRRLVLGLRRLILGLCGSTKPLPCPAIFWCCDKSKKERKNGAAGAVGAARSAGRSPEAARSAVGCSASA